MHIHSFGPDGSYDVKDAAMTPVAIVDAAIAKGLGVIAVTDHNRIGNVATAVAAARGKPILVVPGVELTTPGGHILVYAETVEGLQTIMSRLLFSDDRKACRTSTFEVLRVVEAVDGFAIAAHIDLEDGLENAIPGYGDPKTSALTSPVLAALEIAKKTSLDWYTERDTVSERKALLRKRVDALGDPFVKIIPRVQFSDAHTLAALGRNYAQVEKITRLKLHDLTWASLRSAFADPEARVRVEEEIPNATAGFVAMRMRGGFLDGETIGFSPNLTCIVGGRGSGKSTAFEALRASAGHDPGERASSDAWPDEVDVLYRDEFGAETEIRLTAFGAQNISSPGNPLPAIVIDSLAQGAMARTIEKCGDDPSALLALLDDLANTKPLEELAEQARSKLAESQREIARLASNVAQLDPTERLLSAKEALLEVAKAEKGTELVNAQTKLTTAARLRKRLAPEFKALADALKDAADTPLLDDYATVAEDSKALAEEGAPSPVPAVVDRLRAIIAQYTKALDDEYARGSTEIAAFSSRCQQAQIALNEDFKQRIEALRAKGIPLDVKAMTDLVGTIADLKRKVANLKRDQAALTAAQKERSNLLAAYQTARANVTRQRQMLAARLNRELGETLRDLTTRLTFAEARLAPDADEMLKRAMDWRTAAVPKATALVRALGVPGILAAVRARDPRPIAAAKGPDGQAILSAMEAQSLVSKVGAPNVLSQLEECRYDDLPSLVVARQGTDAQGQVVRDTSGAPKIVKRDFAKLSLGQQQAVVLGMLLCSDSRAPLLIDQPEDNLDSAFVFQVLVGALRRIKERRQVILVTHNANIGVLADTDLVVPLKATAERGYVVSPGAVDTPTTRDVVCEVLEGGPAAYKRRGKLYGFR